MGDLPPGAVLESRGDFDPLAPLFARGVEATNGYRTPADTKRLKAEGYTPADNSGHLRGDKVDLVPGKSGWSLNRLAVEARRHFGPDAKVQVHNGTHVDIELPGWGQAPGTPGTRYSGLPDMPEGAMLVQRGSIKGQDLSPRQPAAPRSPALNSTTALTPTGQVHDGDTLGLSNGQNGRLLGYDAFELNQSGRRPNGSLEPLGVESRDFLRSNVSRSTAVNPTGGSTYGRPVVTLGDLVNDPARLALRRGMGVAEPGYLKGSSQFGPYMEAERQARLNLLGGHGTNAETPSQFRHGDGPWKAAEPGTYGQGGEALFWDDPTPQQGLRPEVAKGYLGIWQDMSSTPEDLMAYAKQNGFELDPDQVRESYAKRAATGHPNSELTYQNAPRLLTDPGDGAVGSAIRGLGDPINMLDEWGGLADSLVPINDFDGPRENIWNSSRRFGDIFNNNVDQNRAILGYDDEHHGIARIGGQLASGVLIPSVGIEGVAARATEEALAAGASQWAAEQIGRKALARRLATVGGGEGFLAGAGAAEGDPLHRLPNAALGAAVGAAGGAVIGATTEHILSPLAKRVMVMIRRGDPVPDEMMREVSAEVAPILNEGAQNAGPTPGARNQPQGGVVGDIAPQRPRSAAMAMDDDSQELVGPVMREPDRIDVGQLPPLPDGAVILEPGLGRTPRMDEQASPKDIADAARAVSPDDVISTGSSRVESMEEAAQANPGRFEDVAAPDERDALRVRRIASRNDLYKSTGIRGPFDMTKTLRHAGGVRDENGELAHLGITNAGRKLPFGGNEQFLGKLINERGMSLDEAGEMLWEQGYFKERPTVAEVIDALHDEHLGNSHFLDEDLPEVEAFRQAQAQRYGIEAARDEGRPLAEERGVPATQADMEANQPPATAYEDLPTMGGKVANINLANVETKRDISKLLNTTESRFGGFDAARRGKITQAETEALASELGMRADDLLKRRKGQALNAEQALQARRILAKSGEEVIALAGKARNGSEEDLAAFQRGVIRHAAIQEQVTGATAEAGRALGQFKIAAKSSAHRERILKAAIENMGGRDSLEEMADMILEAQRDPATLNRFIVDAVKPTWKDKLVELWYNSLLSGPQTHAVNILSNAITAGLQLPEHLMAAAIGTTRNKVAQALGRKEVDRVLMSEIGPRAVGLTQGAKEGLRAFKATLRTGEVSDAVTKVESARQEAISGLKGKVIRVPTHLLSAEDEFFKATARRMELAGLSVRKARSEGLKGDALKARIAELNANPTDDMVERSMDYARYLTFQRPLGPAMRHLQAVVQEHPWLKLFVPFVRTPTNILKFAVERSPAAPLLREVRAEMKAGGARRDLALARMALGTGLGVLVAQWTADGTITGGGPADPNAKRLMQADGWQPYSIRIGGKYYSYKRLDPLATTIGVVADAVNLQEHMTGKQRDHVGALVISSIMRNLENKTWLSGISDALQAIEEPERKGQAFIERLAGSVAVPALVSQTARVIDPVARETSSESAVQGILDSIRSRIPFASKGLLPKRDAFGEEIKNEGGLGPDLASPIWTSTAKDDPVVREVLNSGATIGKPQNDFKGGKLPDSLFNDYQAIAGQLTKQYIAKEIRAPEWKTLTGAERRNSIDAAKKAARSDARDALMQTENQ